MRFIGRRLAFYVITLWAAVTINFFIPRMIPGDAKLRLQIDVGSWPVPPVFDLLARGGGVSPDEMLRTFNMGLGMLVCVPAGRVAEAQSLLEEEGERTFEVGQVAASDRSEAPVELRR